MNSLGTEDGSVRGMLETSNKNIVEHANVYKGMLARTDIAPFSML